VRCRVSLLPVLELLKNLLFSFLFPRCKWVNIWRPTWRRSRPGWSWDLVCSFLFLVRHAPHTPGVPSVIPGRRPEHPCRR
jgi:hypothetical protein